MQWELSYIEYVTSHSGTARIRLIRRRTTRRGRAIREDSELLISRSDIRQIYNAIAKFANEERESVRNLPL
jgi:hypothetical protein